MSNFKVAADELEMVRNDVEAFLSGNEERSEDDVEAMKLVIQGAFDMVNLMAGHSPYDLGEEFSKLEDEFDLILDDAFDAQDVDDDDEDITDESVPF